MTHMCLFLFNRVSLTRHATTKEGIDDLKSQGYKILASDLSPGAVSLFDLRETLSNPDEKFCFMFGNESDGITDEVRPHLHSLICRTRKNNLSLGCSFAKCRT
jgi:tRNA G18 (ribose-2'-O)-methylase SpoU